MDLNHLLVFKTVVETGSFTAAGKNLGLPKSSVSQKISQLEDSLDVRLLNRSTRKHALTDIGKKIYLSACAIADHALAVKHASEIENKVPSGLIRVSAAHDLGGYLARTVAPKFLKDFPQVELELELNNQFIDIVAEGFDMAIRATSRALPDSSHLAKKLANIHFCLYQGTSYQNKSEMKTPTDLLQEKIVLFNFLGRKRNNQIELNHLESGKRVELTLQPSIIFNDAGAAIEAVRSGLGIALLPDFLCLDYPDFDSRSLIFGKI